MMKARVTSKGQITVPKKIRDHLGIQPGDDLLFNIRGKRVEVLSRRSQGVRELAGLFRTMRAAKNERVRSWAAATRRLGRKTNA